jgi:hypothetical protein
MRAVELVEGEDGRAPRIVPAGSLFRDATELAKDVKNTAIAPFAPSNPLDLTENEAAVAALKAYLSTPILFVTLRI